jgi:hypothetical protein
LSEFRAVGAKRTFACTEFGAFDAKRSESDGRRRFLMMAS